jgi:hypothetical protein
MEMKDKFVKFYTIFLWTFFIILMSIWLINIKIITQNVNAQEIQVKTNISSCKELEEENIKLRLEIENLKLEKFESNFSNCRNFCRRLQ